MSIKGHSERKKDSEDCLVSWEGREWPFMHLLSGSITSPEQGFSRNGLAMKCRIPRPHLGPAGSQSLGVGPGICLLAPT